MANIELKIETAEAKQKIEVLKADIEKLKISMIAVKHGTEEASKSMREFVEACSNIKVDL